MRAVFCGVLLMVGMFIALKRIPEPHEVGGVGFIVTGALFMVDKWIEESEARIRKHTHSKHNE